VFNLSNGRVCFRGPFHWGALVAPRGANHWTPATRLLHGGHSLLHLPFSRLHKENEGGRYVLLQYTRKASRATARPFHSIPVSFTRGSHIFPPLATPSPFHQRNYTTFTLRAPNETDRSILTTIQWPTNNPVASTTLIPSTQMMARSSRTRRRVAALRVSAPQIMRFI
jgi:hypothetical protein